MRPHKQHESAYAGWGPGAAGSSGTPAITTQKLSAIALSQAMDTNTFLILAEHPKSPKNRFAPVEMILCAVAHGPQKCYLSARELLLS
jgi:hypothetical protein